MVVFLLFIGLIWRILVIGWRSRERVRRGLRRRLAAMVVFQMLVNAGMVAGMMPVTGIPLPFITHGGASLVSIAIGLGRDAEHQHQARASPAGQRAAAKPQALRLAEHRGDLVAERAGPPGTRISHSRNSGSRRLIWPSVQPE